MAFLKWKPIKTSLNKAISYVINDGKTDNGNLVTSYMCDSSDPKKTAKDFFKYNKFNLKKNVLAHHLIQSYHPDENITPEKAHELGLELCKRYFGGERQFIISTHIDRGHIHNHIIFNSYSLNKKSKKFDNSIKNLYKIRNLSDKISKREKLNIINNKSVTYGKSYYEYVLNMKNIGWKQALQLHIVDTLEYAKNFEEFQKDLLTKNWRVEKLEKNYIFINLKNGKKVKSLKLGKKFQVENIEKVFEKNNLKEISFNDEILKIGEIKDHQINSQLDKYITENNLIQMGKIENYLKENNITAISFVKKYISMEVELENIKNNRLKLIEEKEELQLNLSNNFDVNKLNKISNLNSKIFDLDKKEFEIFNKLDDLEILNENIKKMYNLENYYKEELKNEKNKQENINKKNNKISL